MKTTPDYYRLYWDYYGPSSQPTAQHFHHHLVEFLKKEAQSLSEVSIQGTSLSKLSQDAFDQFSGVESYDQNHSAAWCILPEVQARLVAQTLKAKRGFEIPAHEIPAIFNSIHP